MNEKDPYVLFNEALQVMNKAIIENSDRFPYGQIMRVSEKAVGDRRIGVAVYNRDVDAPYDFYTLALKNGRLELLSHGKEEPDITWKVSRDYLKEVADNEEKYIGHPERLDLDWLKSRFNINA